jgi:putative Holliday junction resolvase
MRILCLDVGSKTIGVAVSDPMGWTAQGIATLTRKDPLSDCREVKRLIAEYGVEKVLVGLPLNMDGTEGTQARFVREFAERMAGHLEVPIVFWDERLSTAGAERGLLEADLSRAKRKRVINQMAAVFILQGYLDSHRS